MKRLAVATALATAGTLTWTMPPAQARSADPGTVTHQVVVVGSLPVGGHARIDYLTGRLLHTRSGRSLTIDVPRRFQNSLELLGRSARGGWVVAYYDRDAVLAVSPAGKAHTITHFYEDYPGASQLFLSENGRQVAIQGVDEGDAAYLRVVDLDGRTLGRHTWMSGGQTLAFQQGTVWFSKYGVYPLRGSLVRWQVGRPPTATPARAVELLDLKHHQLLRDVATDPEYRGGVAPVAKPDAVRWSVCETCHPSYWASSFSPDGRWLLGELGYRSEQVRSADDGGIRSELAFSRPVVGEVWEGSHHLLVEVVRGSGEKRVHALVRCSLDGSCRRVSAWQHHWMLSYPT